MSKRIKVLIALALTTLSLMFVSCGSGEEDITNESSKTETDVTDLNRYEEYLVNRYDYYFNNSDILNQYKMYNIYSDNFDYVGTYDEFAVGYNQFYSNEKANLEAFKKDIEGNYQKGNAEVDKYHNEVITSIDNSINTMNEYGTSFVEKTKGYGTLAKDEVIKGLKDIGSVPHEARMNLDKVINDAKARMGID